MSSLYGRIRKNMAQFQKVAIPDTEICLNNFSYPKPIDDGEYDEFSDERIPFFYISDIHLEHRIMNEFKGKTSRAKIRLYISQLVRKMIDSIGTKPDNGYLLIVGDTAGDFELIDMFYTELLCYWDASQIIVISGNHELWSPNMELKENIQSYRAYFNKQNIIYCL